MSSTERVEARQFRVAPPPRELAGRPQCQVLLQQNLTHTRGASRYSGHEIHSLQPSISGCGRNRARARIENAGERIWRLQDFRDLPFAAVAQTLSRLTKVGVIERLSKGLYYRARETSFGKSLPNPAAIQNLATRKATVFPSGTAAANLLGFTTQVAARTELATSALSLPRKLVGKDTVVHARRPEAWAKLTASDAALLDMLRSGCRTSELTEEATIRRVLELLRESGRFARLLGVASTEPPRVRAMLGALAEALGKPTASLKKLRDSLNPLSRFDFDKLATLKTARAWQAKERHKREAL